MSRLEIKKTFSEWLNPDYLQWVNKIPPIIDPYGEKWEQPDPSQIVIDADVAIMTGETFRELQTLNFTFPSSGYPGKMWKHYFKNNWYLAWFGYSEKGNDFCSNNFRKISIIE